MLTRKFMKLSDLNFNVKVKIKSLLGKSTINELDLISAQDYSAVTSSCDTEAYVTCQIYSNGSPLGLEQSTTYMSFPTSDMQWNQDIVFPIKYRDLTPTSVLVFTVWEVCHRSQLLSPLSPLSQDPPISLSSLATKSDSPQCSVKYHPSQEARALGGTTIPMFSAKGCLKAGSWSLLLWRGKCGDGQVKSTTPYKLHEAEGLDKLEMLIRLHNMKGMPRVKWLDRLAAKRIQQIRQTTSKKKPYAVPTSHQDMLLLVDLFPDFEHPVVYQAKTCNQALPEILPLTEPARLFVLHDPEISRSNPIEDKYQKLAHASGARHLKPEREARSKINAIIMSPDKELGREAKDLLWTYRFTLLENKRALTKFLRCVDWENKQYRTEAISLLKDWTDIEAVDALELLSEFFTDSNVREYAVKQLENVDDEELSRYLLQLVQALRYEPKEEGKSMLANFLIQRSCQSLSLANLLHWFFMVEKEFKDNGDDSEMYKSLHNKFLEQLEHHPEQTQKEWFANFSEEIELVEELIKLGNKALKPGGKHETKKKRFQTLLREGGDMFHLQTFRKPIICPVRPDITLTGIDPDKSTMFKSAMCPILVAFNTASHGVYKLIFKNGDDLRQDQLIMQMINLMDSLLKKVNLDLKLKPYKILATGPQHGFLEFIPGSSNLGDVLKKYDRNLRKYFCSFDLKPTELQNVLNNFVKSCAGYSIITYILGIGDRHLDNVLLNKNGHLFHIDFGWAFGRDPKAYAAPMKFTKEMVNAMGGPHSAGYRDFQRYCCLAFSILRKHSGLILNMLGLMRDAHIPHLVLDGVDQNLAKIKDKFVLDKSEEEAAHHVLSLINTSMNAMFPVIHDIIHDIAQGFR